jgi:hypothetical protein
LDYMSLILAGSSVSFAHVRGIAFDKNRSRWLRPDLIHSFHPI